MGALLSLDISSNTLCVEGTKLLAKALQSNQTMTSLNISSNKMTYDGEKHGDMSGAAALAVAIPDMKALTSLNISDNNLTNYGSDMSGKLRERVSCVWPHNVLYPFFTGVTALATAIPDMGALSSLNLATNVLGHDGALIICDALLGSRYDVCTSYALPARAHQCVFCFSYLRSCLLKCLLCIFKLAVDQCQPLWQYNSRSLDIRWCTLPEAGRAPNDIS
jgi:hypothetical protein